MAHLYQKNNEARLEHLLLAANAGFILAVIEYANEKGVDDPKIIGFVKAAMDKGIALGSVKENFEYHYKKSDIKEQEKINQIASDIKIKMLSQNQEFIWA
jgi:ketopantoate reductase